MAYDDVAFIPTPPHGYIQSCFKQFSQQPPSPSPQIYLDPLYSPLTFDTHPQNYLSYDPLPKASSQASTDAHLGPPTDYPAPGSSPVPPGSPDMGVGGRVFDFTLLTASPKGKSCLLSWGTCGDCGVNDLSSEEVS